MRKAQFRLLFKMVPPRHIVGTEVVPGSLHTNKILVILGRYPLLGFFCHLTIVPLDWDNGTFNNTDVVEKVKFLVAASQHGGYFGGGRIP